jgi:hypothetical protein
MVDIETYKKLYPNSWIATSDLRSDLDASELANDKPPSGSDLLFPPTIPGYNLQHKRWSTYVLHYQF